MKTKQLTKTLLFGLAILMLNLPTASGQEHIKGNGQVIKKLYNVSDFSEIEISGAFEVKMAQRDKNEVIAEMDENLLKHLKVSVSGDRLYIEFEEHLSISHMDNSTLYISFKQLNNITVNGAVELNTKGVIESEYLEMEINGAGSIDMEMNVLKLRAELNGATSANFKGRAVEAQLSISGAGSLKSRDLQTQDMQITINGAGSAKVFVTKNLDAAIFGIGSISYSGNPSRVNKDISFLGSISAE